MDRLRLSAVVQVVLEGVELPADKSELVAYAERQRHAPQEVLRRPVAAQSLVKRMRGE